MKNKDKYADEILAMACSGRQFAVDKRTGKITLCQDTECEECLFNSEKYCVDTKKEWAEAEYKEPLTNDLISRDALKTALHNFFDGKVIDEPAYILRDVLSIIDNAPSTLSADWDIDNGDRAAYARPNDESQMEWVKIFENPFTNGYVCPFCGHKIQVTEQFLPKVTKCEVCGADMRCGE